MKYLKLVIFCLISNLALTQTDSDIVVSTSTSLLDCNSVGQILVDVNDSLNPMNPLPYNIVLLNLESGEEEYYQMIDFPLLINNVWIGNYIVEIYFLDNCRVEIPITIDFEDEFVPNFEANITTTPASCCSGTIDVDIIDDLDENYTYHLYKPNGINFDLVSSGLIENDNVIVDNLCVGRYKITLETDDCTGYEEVIFLPNSLDGIDLLSISHVTACTGVGSTGDDFSTEDGEESSSSISDGEIHVNIQIVGGFYIQWYDEDGVVIGDEESMTELDIGNYTIKVFAQGTNCLMMEDTYKVCCCSSTDDPECEIFTLDPYILGTVTNATNAISNDGAIVLDTYNGSAVGMQTNWQGPNGYSSTDLNISNLTPGEYTITFTLGCNFSSTRTFIVGNEEYCAGLDIIIDAKLTCALVPQISIGRINTIVLPPSTYLYQWSNGATSEDLNSFYSGEYSVTVTNSIGCTAEQSFFLEGTNKALEGHVDLSVPTGCQTLMEIQGDVVIDSGNPPFTYNWSTGSTDSFSNLEVDHNMNYSVTVTDACNFLKIINGNYNCDDDDLCNDDCIRIRKSGDPYCFDLCEEGPFEFSCDQLIIECNCDDGIERWVHGSDGTLVTFKGGKLKNGEDRYEEDIHPYDLPDIHWWIGNSLTGCKKLITKDWPKTDCDGIFADIIEFLIQNFAPGGNGGSNNSTGCDEDEWEVEYYGSMCLGSRYCPDSDTFEEIYVPYTTCKMNIPETNVTKTYCSEDCELISTTTLSAQIDVDDLDLPWCSECDLGFTSCDDVVNFQDTGNEDGVSMYSHSNSSNLIQFVHLSSLKPYKIKPYYEKWNPVDLTVKTLKINVSGALVHLKDRNDHEYIQYISPDNNFDYYYDTLTTEIIENITVDSLRSTQFYVHYLDSSSNRRYKRTYNYYGIVADNEIPIAPTVDRVYWSSPTTYVESQSTSSGYILNCVGSRNFTLGNRIPRSYNITSTYLLDDRLVVSGYFKGSIEINGVTYTSWEQGRNYSSLIMVYDDLQNLILVKTYKSIIYETIYKNSLVYVAGYLIDSEFQNTQETDVMDEVLDKCGFIDIISLEDNQGIANRNQKNESLKIGVFPNPTNDDLNITISPIEEETYDIELFDINGRLLLNKKNLSSSKLKLNISTLEDGIYMLSVIRDGLQIHLESVVKM